MMSWILSKFCMLCLAWSFWLKRGCLTTFQWVSDPSCSPVGHWEFGIVYGGSLQTFSKAAMRIDFAVTKHTWLVLWSWLLMPQTFPTEGTDCPGLCPICDAYHKEKHVFVSGQRMLGAEVACLDHQWQQLFLVTHCLFSSQVRNAAALMFWECCCSWSILAWNWPQLVASLDSGAQWHVLLIAHCSHNPHAGVSCQESFSCC